MSTKIKYKDTTITIEAGQTATLHTTDEKLTEDIVVTAAGDGGGGSSGGGMPIGYTLKVVSSIDAQSTIAAYGDKLIKEDSGTINDIAGVQLVASCWASTYIIENCSTFVMSDRYWNGSYMNWTATISGTLAAHDGTLITTKEQLRANDGKPLYLQSDVTIDMWATWGD